MGHEHNRDPKSEALEAEPSVAPVESRAGVVRLDYMLWSGGYPKADAVVELRAEFPQHRDAMMIKLHQTVGNGFVQQVLQAERWSEGVAAADGRSDHGTTSLPAAQQRRRANHGDIHQRSEPTVSASEAESQAAVDRRRAADSARNAALTGRKVAEVNAIFGPLQPLPDGARNMVAGDQWQGDIVTAFASASTATRIHMQQRLDMSAVIGSLSDWQACRLGVLTPLVNPAAQQRLNLKRAAYIARTVDEFGPQRADVLVAYIWNGVFPDDASDIMLALARSNKLHLVQSLPTLQQVLSAQGIEPTNYAEAGESWTAVFPGMWHGMGKVARGVLQNKHYGNEELQSQYAALPPTYQSALAQADFDVAEASLNPRNVARGLFDEMTFGIPGGAFDLVAGSVGGVRSAMAGDYAAAGEQFAGAALVVLASLGVKIAAKARAVNASSSTAAIDGAPKQLPAAAAAVTTAASGATESRLAASLGPEAAAMLHRLESTLGRAGIEGVAAYIRADSRAAIFAAAHGEAGLAALLEAEGSVAVAQQLVDRSRKTTFANIFPEHDVDLPLQVVHPDRLASKSGRLNYVVTTDGKLILGRQKNAPGGGHIDLANGQPVVAAGEIYFREGSVVYVDNSSGHYLPKGPTVERSAVDAFHAVGIDIRGKFVNKIYDDVSKKWVSENE